MSSFLTLKKNFLRYLRSLNKYFWKYRWRFLLGLVFIILSNYFRILSPQITGYVVNAVEKELTDSISRKKVISPANNKAIIAEAKSQKKDTANYDILVKKFIRKMNVAKPSF